MVEAVIVAAGFAGGVAAGVTATPGRRRSRPSRAPIPSFRWDLQGAGRGVWFKLAPRGAEVVYVIRRVGEDNAKIGWTNNLRGRLRSFQAGSDTPIVVEGLAPGGEREEAAIHAALKRVPGCWVKPPKGAVMGDEWFRLPPDQAPLWRDRVERAYRRHRDPGAGGQLELGEVAA